MKRRILAAAIGILLAAIAAPASAHPLGNYTVNRAVAVTIGLDRLDVIYVVDMAEIPALAEIASIDRDGNGSVSSAESRDYAASECDDIRAQLRVALDGRPLTASTAAVPELTFPDGAGGLQTLRLVCHMELAGAGASGTLTIDDPIDDGHVGWREVTIASRPGVRLRASSVPALSASAFLTAYPSGRLESPPDIRHASASYGADATAVGDAANVTGTGMPAPTAGDPLAALIAGDLSPAIVILALLAAAGLGAAHALSPGHGKALVAAYLIGSRGTVRQALSLGATVAATHTAGVLILGGLVLVAGELFLPELVIGWLTLASGLLMAMLGAVLLWRAILQRVSSSHHHDDHHHHHAHGQPHSHPHPHSTGDGHSHDVPYAAPPSLTVRSVAMLGVAGGLVPSASALIVLLAAVTTGRLVFGLGLIVAFGLGMAVVLGGLAVVTIFAHRWLGTRIVRRRPMVSQLARLVPIGSGVVVLAIGLGIAWSAVSRLG